MLAAARCAITHAGTVSINECVHFGVPMLFYPVHGDQFGNAARAVYHGLAINGDRGHDTSAEIAGHVNRLLNESVFKEKVEDMRTRFEAYRSEDVLARRVAELGGV